jgi:hypothetical protein
VEWRQQCLQNPVITQGQHPSQPSYVELKAVKEERGKDGWKSKPSPQVIANQEQAYLITVNTRRSTATTLPLVVELEGRQ